MRRQLLGRFFDSWGDGVSGDGDACAGDKREMGGGHGNKLRLGHLKGNRFAIKIRDVNPTDVVKAIAADGAAGAERDGELFWGAAVWAKA